MYRSRITKWGLDKNIKEHEARAIVQMHAQRRGRPTQTELRGQIVDFARIESYLTRKGLSIRDVLKSATGLPQPMDIVCRTPSPQLGPNMATASYAPSLNSTMLGDPFLIGPYVFMLTTIAPRIESSKGLKTIEHLVADIAEYMTGCSKIGVWFEQEDADYRCSVWHGPDPAIGHLVRQTVRALECKDRADGDAIISGAFTAIDAIVRTQGIETIQDLLKFVDLLTENNQHHIAWFLCLVIAAIAFSEHAKEYGFMTPVFGRIFSRMALILQSEEPHHMIWKTAQRVTADSIEATVTLTPGKPSPLMFMLNLWYGLRSDRLSIDPDMDDIGVSLEDIEIIV